MNLSQMAAFICGKINQTETEDVSACKEFLRRRHEMIWQDDLWKDSLAEYRRTISPDGYDVDSNWLPTKGVLLIPPTIERVLAVRTDSRKLNVRRPEYFYRVDADLFSRSGQAAEFLLLPPCVWEWDTAQYVWAWLADAGDNELSLITDILDTDDVSVTRLTAVLDTLNGGAINQIGEQLQSAATERIDAILKVATAGAVTVVAGPSGAQPTLRNLSTATVTFGFADVDDVGSIGLTYTLAAGESQSIVAPGHYAWLRLSNGTYSGAGTLLPYNGDFPGFISTSDGATIETDGLGITIATLDAEDTAAIRRQRVRLVEIPNVSTVIRVLGKRACPGLDNDADEPAITGSTNALLAFALADMLERARQYGKAAAKLQNEAVPLLGQLKAQETVQQAHNVQIVPESGYGEHELERSRGFSF